MTTREIAALELSIARDRTERETGVAASLLAGARTVEEVEQLAGELLAWKLEGQPTPPATAAVSASIVNYGSSGSPLDGRIVGPPQILSRSELAAMTPADRMAAWRSGRLATMLGASPYPPPGR